MHENCQGGLYNLTNDHTHSHSFLVAAGRGQAPVSFLPLPLRSFLPPVCLSFFTQVILPRSQDYEQPSQVYAGLIMWTLALWEVGYEGIRSRMYGVSRRRGMASKIREGTGEP